MAPIWVRWKCIAVKKTTKMSADWLQSMAPQVIYCIPYPICFCIRVRIQNRVCFCLLFDIKTETDIWDNDECNAYNGTDATILPPLLDPNDGLMVFEPIVCRNLRSTHTNYTKISGIPLHVYELNISDEANTRSCFCRGKHQCPPEGAFDLFRCTGKIANSLLFVLKILAFTQI